MRSAVIVDAVRTASGRGKLGGALSGVHPAELLAQTIRALMARNELDPRRVEDVLVGCVSQSGDQSLNVARTALLAAGLPESVPGTTIDRQCGSSQQAVHFGAQGVIAGAYDVVIAGGVESMSRVPMFHATVDGDPFAPLADRYPEGLVTQGISAELVAARSGLDRDRLDEFSAESHRRAAAAQSEGLFSLEIVGIEAPDGSGTTAHVVDQTVRPGTTVEALGGLKSSFYDPALAERFPEIAWSITPGNSSPLTDGASAVLIVEEAVAASLGLAPRARLTGFAVTGSDPLTMLTGVVPATQMILDRAGITIDAIDAYEVNEAFAPVPLHWLDHFGADPEKLNPRGGAIALGHPLGASGTRLLATLVNHLEATGGRYGLQAMCEGGGMANATLVERL